MDIISFTTIKPVDKTIGRLIFNHAESNLSIKVYATPISPFDPDKPAFVLSASIVDAVNEDALSHPADPAIPAVWHSGAASASVAMGETDLPITHATGEPIKGQVRIEAAQLQQYSGTEWQDYGPALSSDPAIVELQLTFVKQAKPLAVQAVRWWQRASGLGQFMTVPAGG